MKKMVACVLCALLLAGCSPAQMPNNSQKAAPTNFSDEMKLEKRTDISAADGADAVERAGDHPDSPYFAHPDFYNMSSSGGLTILPKFKTYQQTSEWSCGLAAAMMILNYYDKLGTYDEASLAQFRTNKDAPEATSLESLIKVFEGVGGFDVHSTYDYAESGAGDDVNLGLIRNYLAGGIPVAIAWNDWGGHWQVVIGYDDMGTPTEQDDVIIVADPYDTTDHNQDGYGIYPAQRFYYNWTMYDFFTAGYGINERAHLFLAAVPIEK